MIYTSRTRSRAWEGEKTMYVHIGSNKSVRASDIVAIFDLDTSTVSVHTRNFLSRAQKDGKVRTLGLDLPKSFILMNDGTVYLSPFNTATVKAGCDAP